ncbi:MAG: tRNA (adenosine(37)-N6)-threonylcarbamoyltransferase complex ATPase subunit type 1 TsaE [Vulcanimicrobiaceae bacterium]
MILRRTCTTEADLAMLAADFGARLMPGDVVALAGPLGAGKTAFVRALVEARLGGDPVSSPTFVFRHRYPGTPPIEHLDLYRIEDPRELPELGLEEAFDGEAIVLVEWWRHAPSLLPARRYEVEIDGAGAGPRTVAIREPA